MRSRYTPCPDPQCPELVDRTLGDCPNGHAASKRKAAQRWIDAARPNARARGYGTIHTRRFRAAVLRRDPRCVLCAQPARHADHHPLTRAELVRLGMDPNDPRHGRGLCASCHSRETAKHDGGYGNPAA